MAFRRQGTTQGRGGNNRRYPTAIRAGMRCNPPAAGEPVRGWRLVAVIVVALAFSVAAWWCVGRLVYKLVKVVWG